MAVTLTAPEKYLVPDQHGRLNFVGQQMGPNGPLTRYGTQPSGNLIFDSSKPRADGGYGAWVDSGTGGIANNGRAGMGWVVNGQWQSAPPAGGDQPQFGVVKTVKQPEIAGAVTNAIGQQVQQQNQTQSNLDRVLAELSNASKQSFQTSQAANDTSKVENQLTTSMRGEETARRSYLDEQQALNRNYRGETASLLEKLSSQLDAGEAAARATAEQAAARGLSASNLAIATNPDVASSRSGARSNRAIQAVMNAMLPVSERFAERRYLQTANIEQPLIRENFANDSALLTARGALEREFGGNWRNIYQYIQSLKREAASMQAVDAERYIGQQLNLLGVPAQMLAGNLSNLARLQQLDALANEYTFTTPYEDRTPDVFTPSVTTPNRSYVSRNDGGTDIATLLAAIRGSNAPSVPPMAAANDMRSREAARQSYIAQTGFDPSTDPQFNPDVWNRNLQHYSGRSYLN